jgi:two-component system chemotaxis sensor kinase CheA
MFGYERINEFTHHLETIYDLVRNDKLALNKAILDVTFKSIDHITMLLDYKNELPSDVMAAHTSLMNVVIAISDDSANSETSNPNNNDTKSESKQPESETNENTYYIYFEPHQDICKFGTNPLYLIEDVIQLGKAAVFPKTHKIPALSEIDAESLYISWEILLATKENENDIKDVFIFVEDDCNLTIEHIAKGNIISDFLIQAITPISQSETLLTKEILLKAIAPKQESTGAKPEADKKPKRSLKEKIQEATKQTETSAKITSKDSAISSIRVSSDKLDTLMNLISELVTFQARLSLFAENYGISELSGLTENMEKISRRLRDTAFSICLIPLESMLTRFQRLVRDVSSEIGKDVKFITEGAETELDKTIIESLADPIMHILRNSLDHGIESAERRAELGKPAQGTIKLKAYYSGTSVYIEIKDDGGGIPVAKIRNKAIEKGMMTADQNLTDKEILDFIFAPGFSTAAKVTELSGRGVGMDVVRRKISDIRGDVEIDSVENVGTTITIRLPLTLSIIDGLLVKVAETLYIIPLSVINNIFAAKTTDLKEYNDLLVHEGEKIPYVNLRNEFIEQAFNSNEVQVVVVNFNDYKVGLVVDQVVGEYQAVLKPLGKMFKKQDFVSGATILGDGTIALVIDSGRIIKQFIQKTKEN